MRDQFDQKPADHPHDQGTQKNLDAHLRLGQRRQRHGNGDDKSQDYPMEHVIDLPGAYPDHETQKRTAENDRPGYGCGHLRLSAGGQKPADDPENEPQKGGHQKP